jgi:hypothetical protein
MQTAETVLEVLRERGRHGLPCNELYRQMFNFNLYLLAYGKIYANQGAVTPGASAETADGMSEDKIHEIIGAMRAERYRFSPARRVFIPKKNGKMRPLGLPSWSDKLVGEVVRLLLQAYYEPTFSGNSQHGGEQFRLPVQDSPQPFPVDRDRGQQPVQAAGVRQVAEPAADDLVQDVRADEVEQRPDPGLARGDDLPPQRVKPPAQVPEHALGQVSCLVADFPERLRPGQRARGRDGEDEHERVAAGPGPGPAPPAGRESSPSRS